jgi:hypothetical protein
MEEFEIPNRKELNTCRDKEVLFVIYGELRVVVMREADESVHGSKRHHPFSMVFER